MKFSLVFCGFLLVWHSGNVFVRSEDPLPSTLPATPAPGGTSVSTTPTRINSTSPSSTTPSPSATPGGTNATTTPTRTNATSPSSPTPSASAIPGGTNATTTPTRTNATSPSSPTPVASTSATVPSLTNAPGTSKPSDNVTKITTPGPAVSTASTPAQGDVTTVSRVTTTGSTTVALTTTTPPTTPTTPSPNTTPPTTPTTPSPNTTPPTTAPLTIDVNISISETNLLLADINFFIELSGPANRSLSGITLVVYNATGNTELENVTFTTEDKLNTNGLYIHKLKNDTWKNLDTALLVLYKPGSSYGEVMNFIIASGSTSAANSVSPALKEKLGLENKLIIIVNKRKLADMNISGAISLNRCDKGGKLDLIISYRSMDAVNNCTFPNDVPHGFEFRVMASGCIAWDKYITTLQDEIINNVNKLCQCGMTSSLLDHVRWTLQDSCSSNKEESTTNIFSGKFVSMFANQTSAIQEAYTTFVMTSPNITVESHKFTVTNCSLVCLLPAPHIPSKDKGNISMTVAVVLSCIAVFLIILVAVVIYLRRQRRGVHQFRMTRLAEDDDMDDMEDFVGGPMDDHEPSFNNSHYKASG